MTTAATKAAPLGEGVRILLVINSLTVGGTETALVRLTIELKARGHDVAVLSLRDGGPLASILVDNGIPVLTLAMAEKPNLPNTILAIVRFARLLTRERFAVVHSFLPRANVLSRIANRLSGHVALHISSERSTDYKRSPLICRLNRYTAIWTDRILAVAPIVQRVLIERDRLPSDKIAVLGNGIDLSAVDRIPALDVHALLNLPRDVVLMCSVGRLVYDKGHWHLLQAFSRLVAGWPQLHLVLVGDGPEADSLRRIASREGMDGRVHMLGFRDDVLAILKGCDLFVLPSLEEGIPVTLLEAMACSTPVVATRVGGIPDIVESGVTGLLVTPAEKWEDRSNGVAAAAGHRKPDDAPSPPTNEAAVADLTQAIESLLLDGNLLSRIARNARERLQTTYALSSVVSSLEAEYKQLLTSRAANQARHSAKPERWAAR